MAEGKQRRAERVAARFAQQKPARAPREGVVPLATGYFQVEKMRMRVGAKAKATRRAKLKSSR